MNRRDFLKYVSLVGASVALGKTSAYANWLTNERRNGFPQGMLLIDAHAHPDQFYYLGPEPKPPEWIAQFGDKSSTLEKIMKLGMQGSSFAALGDSQSAPFTWDQVILQMQKVISLEEQGFVRIFRRHRDMPHGNPSRGLIPGAILSLEGATPLGQDEATVFENLGLLYYQFGVRMITLMHYLDNQFGQSMAKQRPKTNGSGLSGLGQAVIAKMMELGIAVDVAHAHYPTLRDIVEIAIAEGTPLIDSHTSLSPCEEFCGGRLRTWEEMEMIASTGGVVCTWPLKWTRQDGSGRLTLADWAAENYEMKRRLGIEHIALGTDGGGVLPERVEGYESILDLPKLVMAMQDAGFKRGEIEAYMGGNLFRVMKRCI